MRVFIPDTFADAMGRIETAYKTNRAFIVIPNNKMVRAVLKILESEGLLNSYTFLDSGEIKVFLRYFESAPLIKGFGRVSRIARRVNVRYKELSIAAFENPMCLFIISTKMGVMTFVELFTKGYRVGGELILIVEIL